MTARIGPAALTTEYRYRALTQAMPEDAAMLAARWAADALDAQARRCQRCKGCVGCRGTAGDYRAERMATTLMAAPVPRQHLGAYKALVRAAISPYRLVPGRRPRAGKRSIIDRELTAWAATPLVDLTYGVVQDVADLEARITIALARESRPRLPRLDVPRPALQRPRGGPAPLTGNVAARWDAVCARVAVQPAPARIVDVTALLATSGESWGREADETGAADL